MDLGVVLPHPRFDPSQGLLPLGRRHQVGLVDHHQGGGCEPDRRRAPAVVEGVEVGGRVDDLDEPTAAYALDAAEPDQLGQGAGLGQPAGLDDDDVEPEPRVGQLLQGVVEAAGVGQAAQAAAGDGGRLVDLAGDEAGVDVDVAEVVDDHAHPGTGLAQQMVEHRGLPRPEMTGEDDHGNAGAGVGWHRAIVEPVRTVPVSGSRCRDLDGRGGQT
ncbi:hypothetical protein HD557_001584 [Nocardioides luteus]|nr:hypothetical protein [Nocardioides luteus]MBG6095602.1 hypothetical protein [Nocardioides luteus]